jgi:serine/threonine protein kinase
MQHAVFMHSLKIAHLDISLRNLLSNYNGRCAYIDFELARRFEGDPNPRIACRRGTEVPPECEQGKLSDPYKIDVWALGILILRICKVRNSIFPVDMN